MTHEVQKLYSVYDMKAVYFLPPMTARSDADAIRAFTETVVTSDLPISKYPADFALVQVGTMDVISGAITAVTPPAMIINGLVALEEATRERSRYQTILQAAAAPEASPDAS